MHLLSVTCSIALTSAGLLAARALQHNVARVTLPMGHVPRAVLPWFIGSLLAVTQEYGLLAGRMICDELSVHWRAHGNVAQYQHFHSHLCVI